VAVEGDGRSWEMPVVAPGRTGRKTRFLYTVRRPAGRETCKDGTIRKEEGAFGRQAGRKRAPMSDSTPSRKDRTRLILTLDLDSKLGL
jgi:hypothetical protein